MKKRYGLPGNRGVPATGSDKGSSGLTFRSQAGFTMMEVLVVIIILGILASLAIPGFARWLPNYRLRGAARDLYSNFQLAKAGAIKDRVEWAVRFTNANTYEVWSALDPDTPSQNRGWNSFSATDDTLVKTVSLPAYGSNVACGAGSASFDVVTGGAITPVPASPVYFNSRGFTTNNTAVFAYLTNSKNTSYAVGTWASGSVILRKWNGTTWQ